jgi:hypothetical protein
VQQVCVTDGILLKCQEMKKPTVISVGYKYGGDAGSLI